MHCLFPHSHRPMAQLSDTIVETSGNEVGIQKYKVQVNKSKLINYKLYHQLQISSNWKYGYGFIRFLWETW